MAILIRLTLFISALSLCTLFTLRFVGVIDYAWSWILSPMWLAAAIVLFSINVSFVIPDMESKKEKETVKPMNATIDFGKPIHFKIGTDINGKPKVHGIDKER